MFSVRDIQIGFWAVFVVAMVNGLILVAALFTRKQNRLPNSLFSIIIIAMLYMDLIHCLSFSGIPLLWPTQLKWSLPLWLTAIPAVYFYAVSMITPHFRFTLKDAFHLLPASLAFLWCSYLVLSGASVTTYASLYYYGWERYVLVVTFAAYFVAAEIKLRDFRSQMDNYFSNFDHVRLRWLGGFLILLLPLWLLAVADLATGPEIPLWKWWPLLSTMVILAMGFCAVRQSVIFFPSETPVVRESSPPTLSDSELQHAVVRLTHYMKSSQAYLDPELRLKGLTEALAMRPQLISEVLNRGLKTNFYEFVNSYRIGEAKLRLVDPAYRHLNILGIASDSGFNSKSVFNQTFKKMTGLTPSEYRSQTSSKPS